MVVAGAILSLTDSLAKHLTGIYPIGEILFFRSLFVFIPILFMVSRNGGMGSLRVNNWGGRILYRGGCVLFTTFGFVMAIKVMPLADVIAIFFVSPIFGTAMAPFLLGEKVGWRRWTAVLIGFAGVLFMIKPGSNPLVWIAVFALAAALRFAPRYHHPAPVDDGGRTIQSVLLHRLCIDRRSLRVAFRMEDAGSLRHWHSRGDGRAAEVGQYFLVIAFRFGEVAVLAPFRYFNLVWAVIYGYLFSAMSHAA